MPHTQWVCVTAKKCRFQETHDLIKETPAILHHLCLGRKYYLCYLGSGDKSPPCSERRSLYLAMPFVIQITLIFFFFFFYKQQNNYLCLFFLPENVQKHERLVENRLSTGIHSSLLRGRGSLALLQDFIKARAALKAPGSSLMAPE